MRIGVTIAFNHLTHPSYIAQAARFIEEAGFHSIWVPEHVLFFPEYASKYPYAADGRVPGNPQGVLDPFTALTFVAAHTTRLRLGTGICLVPQRQPVYTAKMVADLDYLSGGRVDFGVGIGWLAEEFAALGMDFRVRARRCAEYIDAMKALWRDGVASFSGETLDIQSCYFNPKPMQKPHPPIFFGGESDAALNRVAAQGDGWYGFDLDPAGVREHLAKLDRKLADAGRSRKDIQVFVAPNRHRVAPETVAAYREAGVDQLITSLFARDIDDLKRRAERVLTATAA
ncbi:MAG TPA: LLM class F420-dependent oxidoreductase [Pseudomonadales bacterium]|nr:LLM class F420-dependent oxidoreductase [Pseudomonadales bacterium]